MSIHKSFLTFPPNICPKSILKTARLDSSMAKHFHFLRYPANFECDASVSVVVSFFYDSFYSFHNVSSVGIVSSR